MLKSRQINASAYFFSFVYGPVNSNPERLLGT